MTLKKYTAIILITAILLPNIPGHRAIAQNQPASPQKISSTLKDFLRRAKFPGMPGAEAGIPNDGELKNLESDFLSWKERLESALKSNQYSSVQKTQIIDAYFQELTKLILVRIALKKKIDSSWKEAFSLAADASILKNIPGIGAITQDRLGFLFSSLVFKNNKIELSESLIQGLEVGALANSPNEESFFTLIQYLVLRQQLQNISQISLLLGEKATFPKMNASLINKLQSFKLSDELLKDQQQLIIEPTLRSHLLAAIKDMSVFHQFMNQDTANKMAGLLQNSSANSANLKSVLYSEFKKILTEEAYNSFEQTVLSSSIRFNEEKESDTVEILKEEIANSCAEVILSKLLYFLANGTITLSLPEREELTKLIENRRENFIQEISTTEMQKKLSENRRKTEIEVPYAKKIELRNNLLAQSTLLSKQFNSFRSTLNFSALSKVIKNRLENNDSLTDKANSVLSQLSSAASWTAAKETYSLYLLSLTDESIVNDDGVHLDKLNKKIEDTKWLEDKINFGSTINPALAQKLKSTAVKNIREDIQQLLKIGKAFQFSEQSAPILDTLIQKDEQESYREFYKENILQSYPIFSVTVQPWRNPNRTGRGGPDNTPKSLYTVLQSILAVNPDLAKNPNHPLMKEIDLRIEVALKKMLTNTESAIKRASNAKSLDELSVLASTSMMIGTIIQAFPEFIPSHEAFLERILSSSPIDIMIHRHVTPYLVGGFSSLMLLQLTRWGVKRSAPFIDTIFQSMSPFINGYMKSATFVLVADTAYQAHDLYKARRDYISSKETFLSQLTGTPISSLDEFAMTQSKYAWSKYLFMARLVMDSAFLYYPLLKGAIASKGSAISAQDGLEDVRAFLKLKLQPGDWQGVELVKARGNITSEQTEAAEHLIAKIKSGDTWTLQDNSSEGQKKLMQLLKGGK